MHTPYVRISSSAAPVIYNLEVNISSKRTPSRNFWLRACQLHLMGMCQSWNYTFIKFTRSRKLYCHIKLINRKRNVDYHATCMLIVCQKTLDHTKCLKHINRTEIITHFMVSSILIKLTIEYSRTASLLI